MIHDNNTALLVCISMLMLNKIMTMHIQVGPMTSLGRFLSSVWSVYSSALFFSSAHFTHFVEPSRVPKIMQP